jgi:hypothetical protein
MHAVYIINVDPEVFKVIHLLKGHPTEFYSKFNLSSTFCILLVTYIYLVFS